MTPSAAVKSAGSGTPENLAPKTNPPILDVTSGFTMGSNPVAVPSPPLGITMKMPVLFTMVKPQTPVGGWKMDPTSYSVTIAVYARPTDEQIKATNQTFGWTWVDL
jgi:hypothetical protein